MFVARFRCWSLKGSEGPGRQLNSRMYSQLFTGVVKTFRKYTNYLVVSGCFVMAIRRIGSVVNYRFGFERTR